MGRMHARQIRSTMLHTSFEGIIERMDVVKRQRLTAQEKVSVVESASLHQGHIKYLMSDKQYDHFLITTDCSRYGPHLEASVNMVCELFNLNVKKDQFPLVLKDNRNNNAAAVLGSYLVFPTDTGSFNISNPKREVFGTVKLNKNYVNKGVSLKKPLLYSIVKEIYQANTGV